MNYTRGDNAIEFVAGRTYQLTVNIADDNGIPFVWSNEGAGLGVKRNPNDSAALFVLSGDTSENGKAVFTFSPSDTATLTPGTYWYDVSVSGDAVYTVIPCSQLNLLPRVGW